MKRYILPAAILLAAPWAGVVGQTPAASQFNRQLAERRDVRDALRHLETGFTAQVDEWIRIAQIQGKSQHEQERGALVQQAMRAEGLEVSVDSIGNVIGRRRGTGGGPTVAFAAHLDIVHPLGTDLTVRHAGDTLHAPGIFDNSASVANMLAVIRALNAAHIRTSGDLVFIGTAQEELGLHGMTYWLDHNPRPDVLIAMDGGLGPISYGALGIHWTKYHFKSAGSHTNTSRGRPTPVKALADAVSRIYATLPPPLPSGAVINVGQIHGGEIFNGIPENLFFTIDLRSNDPALLDSLDRAIDGHVAAAANKEGVEWRKEIVTKERAGGTEEMLRERRAHPLVQTAIDVYRFVGVDLPVGREAIATGSTDANAGVVRGVPSIAVGRSFGGNQHTLKEWAHWPSALPAAKMVLLLAVAMSESPAGRRVVP